MSKQEPKTYTEEWKELHIDFLYDYVMDKKGNEVFDYCAGEMLVTKDNWEDCIEYYIDGNLEELWDEYLKTLIKS